jgi:transcription-repair coupling factor (superfamily II helicase)
LNEQELINYYQAQPFIQEVNERIADEPAALIDLTELKGSAKSVIPAALFRSNACTQLLIVSGQERARYVYTDLHAFVSEQKIHFFPSPYRKDDPEKGYDNGAIQERTDTMNVAREKTSTGHLIVTYPEALSEKVISQEDLQEHTFAIKTGDKLDIDFIIDFLTTYGFERTDFVFEAGTFSIRGGIVDIFSYANEKPYRIEFFEDQVDSIRMFDPESQLSIKKLNAVTIIPNMQEKESSENIIPFLEYLPNNTVLTYDDLDYTAEVLDKFYHEAEERFQQDAESFELKPSEFLDKGQDFKHLVSRFPRIDISTRSLTDASYQKAFRMQAQPAFNKNFELLKEALQKNTKARYQNLIFSESVKQVERIYAIFEDQGEQVDFVPIYQSLHEGFVDDELKLACYSEHQIFNRYHKYKQTSYYKGEQALTLKELRELQSGDFITHIDHGVGVFRGLTKISNNGQTQEAVRLEYKGGDMLYVNIHSLYKISKYQGKEGKSPTLNKLGTNKWANTKQKAKNKVKDIARDLIRLYAKRKAARGYRFSPDTSLQTQLEASFLYEDTPDQAKATEDIKYDMESEYPMDRLICGDVGFGKTEVAMRAAFKAITEGKQVAVLVPTTVLCLQHYKTFQERLKDFPVTVDYISRFRSKKQQNQTLKNLNEGKVDVVIGTHRLTGKDIGFKDLGLLIVDEEQKFGVSSKEKLKSMKANVDTLTLTATPIPRTMQFSLMGARDFSIINTPPVNRQPVETHVEVFDTDKIKTAVEQELERGGQVFFVHNQVKDIYTLHDTLKDLVPQAKIAVGHGQMEGKKLEEVMLNFVDGYYDVLLSTSIVENGLDISNANTIIINQAQNFGLSDLYQLRGRVGRSNVKAQALLLTPGKSVMTQDARRRLSALEEFTDLGSGFNIAMRDLDIRGAGNLLGAEQSGFIAEVGFDMYQKILNEALQELKENEFSELFEEENAQKPEKTFTSQDCQIDTDLEILIPDYYVSSSEERLNLYQKLNGLKDETELATFKQNLEDRFGPVPRPTNELLDTIRLKWLGMEVGIEKIILKNGKLKATFMGSEQNNEFYQSDKFGEILSFVQEHPEECRFDQQQEGLKLTIFRVRSIQEALSTLNRMANRAAVVTP